MTFTVNLINNNLSSRWDGLSPHLIASFYPVERVDQSREWQMVPDAPIVYTPLGACSLDVSLGWQSPFESSGQSATPTLKAMLQSGALQPWLGGFEGRTANLLGSAEGRTGVTKLNSTQVFSGMPPLRFSVTALFRAWSDPVVEVEKPLDQLMKWALPGRLADDGLIMSMLKGIKEVAQGKPLDKAAVQSFFPSIAPTKLAMRYKGRSYLPLVIERIGLPLHSPVDANGNFIGMDIPMDICSLAAIDSKDWENASKSPRTYPGFSA